VGMWPRTDTQTDGHRPTDRHTDARDNNTFCVVYDSREMCSNQIRANVKKIQILCFLLHSGEFFECFLMLYIYRDTIGMFPYNRSHLHHR